MLIRLGYELIYEFPQARPVIVNLNIYCSRSPDLLRTDSIVTHPAVPLSMYRDGFGNWCTRLMAPTGRFTLIADAVVSDSGLAEPAFPRAFEHTVESLPDETLVYLLPSRYCETELLATTAWSLFGSMMPGWGRVQAFVDWVHSHIAFDYAGAHPTKTAFAAYNERVGVCRALNIPARYCTGYLGDIGVPAVDAPMDFAGWFKAYLGGAWHSFDPRNNQRRIGRVLIARGRDVADVAISMTFGANVLSKFLIWTEEIPSVV